MEVKAFQWPILRGWCCHFCLILFIWNVTCSLKQCCTPYCLVFLNHFPVFFTSHFFLNSLVPHCDHLYLRYFTCGSFGIWDLQALLINKSKITFFPWRFLGYAKNLGQGLFLTVCTGQDLNRAWLSVYKTCTIFNIISLAPTFFFNSIWNILLFLNKRVVNYQFVRFWGNDNILLLLSIMSGLHFQFAFVFIFIFSFWATLTVYWAYSRLSV